MSKEGNKSSQCNGPIGHLTSNITESKFSIKFFSNIFGFFVTTLTVNNHLNLFLFVTVSKTLL